MPGAALTLARAAVTWARVVPPGDIRGRGKATALAAPRRDGISLPPAMWGVPALPARRLDPRGRRWLAGLRL